MTSILAIETATTACSVALLHKDEITEQLEVGNNIHSKKLLDMVDGLLSDASVEIKQLDAIAVGQGPGSFTGLRIGIGVAQGLAYSANLPVLSICSLEALAREFKAERVLAGFDARMSEIYWATFIQKNDVLSKVGEVQVSNPSDIILPDNEIWLAVGTAWLEYGNVLSSTLKQKLRIESSVGYPKASIMLGLAEEKFKKGDTVNALNFEPVYIRNEVAKKKGS